MANDTKLNENRHQKQIQCEPYFVKSFKFTLVFILQAINVGYKDKKYIILTVIMSESGNKAGFYYFVSLYSEFYAT